MTADLSSVAREAAEAEGLRRIPPQWMAFHGGTTADQMVVYRNHFIAGFTECASRIPNEEEIAAEMKRHHFADNLLGNITWDMWMAKCECGWESGEYRYPGESSDAYYAHAAGAVLALIGEKIRG